MYFSYGWPRSLVTGATAADSEAIYAAQGTGEYIVVVFNATIQVRAALVVKTVSLPRGQRLPRAVPPAAACMCAVGWCGNIGSQCRSEPASPSTDPSLASCCTFLCGAAQ